MDPVSILILKHRLQAVVFKRNLLQNFTNIFTSSAGPSESVWRAQNQQPKSNRRDGFEEESLHVEPSAEAQEPIPVESETDIEEEPQDLSTENTQFDPEVAQKMSPEEIQAYRERAYIKFDVEEVDDYTDGPPRLIAGDDGIKPCAALFLTYEMS